MAEWQLNSVQVGRSGYSLRPPSAVRPPTSLFVRIFLETRYALVVGRGRRVFRAFFLLSSHSYSSSSTQSALLVLLPSSVVVVVVVVSCFSSFGFDDRVKTDDPTDRPTRGYQYQPG